MSVSHTIQTKADQLNAEDLIDRTLTLTITKVKVLESGEQPVWIHSKEWPQPYKPCKTFRRVLVELWGDDETTWIGRGITVFRNPETSFGGEAVGGIEISHATNISRPTTVTVKSGRGKKRKITIGVLAAKGQQATSKQPESDHPLAKPHAAMKQLWWQKIGKAQAGNNKPDPEAFGKWVGDNSAGAVMDTDANKPEFYDQKTIEHLTKILNDVVPF